MSITIGWHDYGLVESKFSFGIAKTIKEDSKKRNIIDNVISISTPLVDVGRNSIVHEFLNTDSEWLLMVDADTIWHEDMIYSLYDMAVSNNLDILCGLYFNTSYLMEDNIIPAAYIKQFDGNMYSIAPELFSDKDYVEVEWAGAGALLVNRKVYEEIVLDFPSEQIETSKIWFKEIWGEYPEGSEDLFFFRRAKEFGYKVNVTHKVIVPHIKKKIITYQDYERFIKNNV